MKQVNLHAAKTQLSRLVDEAAAGEEIVIAKAGKPVALLGPLPAASPQRQPGGWEKGLWIAEDFDESLSEELLRAFSGDETEDP